MTYIRPDDGMYEIGYKEGWKDAEEESEKRILLLQSVAEAAIRFKKTIMFSVFEPRNPALVELDELLIKAGYPNE